MILLDSTNQPLTLGRIASGANALIFALTNPCRTLPSGKLSQSDARPRAFGITPAPVGGSPDVLCQRMAARETYGNHCDSFCDRREANRGDGVLIGNPVRMDLRAFWHHLSVLDWIVVPVAVGSNPTTHPRITRLALEPHPSSSRLLWFAEVGG